MNSPTRDGAATIVSAREVRWLLAVCFMSGAAGLIFEMAWFHRTSLVFGSSVWSTSVVLSSFMGGLTVGSALVGRDGHRIRHFVRAYAAVEVVVGLSGVLLTHLLPGLTQAVVALTDPGREALWLTNLTRFATAFVVLLVPSTAMGATLPLLVTALARAQARFGSALGRAYGWNTLGAVVGVVGAEVWLIGAFGVAGTAWFAAMLSLGAASLAWAGPSRRLDAGAPVTSTPSVATPMSASSASRAAEPPKPRKAARASLRGGGLEHARMWPLLAASFLAGASLLALEVVWFRFLTMYVLSTTLATSLMLAVVLAAIGLGGLIGSTWVTAKGHATRYLPVVASVAGLSVTAAYAGFAWLTSGVQIASWQGTLWLAMALTFPASLLSGILFTLVGEALQPAVGAETRAAGWLTLANTLGGMCGPLMAAFVLLPAYGMETAFFVLSAAYVGIGVLTLVGTGSWLASARSPSLVLGGLGLVAALVWFPFGQMHTTYFPRVAQPYAVDGSEVVATREGASETIFLMQQKWMGEPVYSRLVTNGFSMSGTSISAKRYMRYFVYWPLMLHRGPIERVLVVCFGVGVTAEAALDLPDVQSIDVAEISDDVVEVSDLMYPQGHPLRDARVRVHIEDGRQFLRTTAERFDLITGEPPPPRTPGAVNIYTREYFELIYDKLAEGGITTYWLPVGRPDPGTNVTSIMRAFCDVFEDCSLWNATPFDLMLVGSRPPSAPVGPVPENDFVRPWRTPALRARFAEIGFEVPQQVGATFLGDAEYVRQLTADAPALDDDHPQRLRPMPGRPSLSDPGYGTDPAVTKLYDAVIDPLRAREAFISSPLIRALWPERVIAATVPYFDEQVLLNRIMWEGGQPLRQIADLHRLLVDTPLRTVPLWVLGIDSVKEGIARRRDDGTGAAQYARGLSALVDRDYGRAAAAFGEAEQRGLRGETIRPLLVYALCLSGQVDTAKQLAVVPRSDVGDEQHFWEWLRARYDVGPFDRP